MKFKLEENRLILFFEGEVNSYNAEDVEKDIEETLKDKTFEKLILHFGELKYISSAGLRIILKLKQKYANLHIVEVNLEVYDVLEMTGFTNILDVKKMVKKIDITGAEVIGEGFFSTVYRIDKDMIIKVFNRVSDPEQIDRELKLAKQAFVLGVPTAISYDVVLVGNKLGVRFEMLDCMSLKNCFKEHPEKYEELIKRYIALLKKINTTDCMDLSIPSMKANFLKKVEGIKEYLPEEAYNKLYKMVDDIKDSMTFVHGDCHFKNIFVQGDDFILIDMDTLSRGEPIFELATLRAPYVAFEEDDPGNCEKFLGMSKELCASIYNDIVKGYLKNPSEENFGKIELMCELHMLWWNKTNTPENKARENGVKTRLLALLDKYNDFNIE